MFHDVCDGEISEISKVLPDFVDCYPGSNPCVNAILHAYMFHGAEYHIYIYHHIDNFKLLECVHYKVETVKMRRMHQAQSKV